ncbi:hypothetical protein ACK3TF_005383 [Chlorella vulgaris]
MQGISPPSTVLRRHSVQRAPSISNAIVLSRPQWHDTTLLWRHSSGGGGLSGTAIVAAPPQGSLRSGSSDRYTCSAGASRGAGSIGGDAIAPKRRGRSKVEAPTYDAQQLLHSLSSNGSPAELRRSMSQLRSKARQQGVLLHAAAVAAHLRGLGLKQQLLEQLLVRCLELFSRPPKDQADGLFSELMSIGLTAAEAARCLIACPVAVHCVSFADSIAVVDDILSHSQDSGKGVKPKVPAAQRTAAAMLRAHPSSVHILVGEATKLRRQYDQLLVLGCTPAAVANMVWQLPKLIRSADSVAQLEQAADVLHDELGLAPETVLERVVPRAPTWLTYSQDTQRRRAAALAEEFGRDEAASIVMRNLIALDCDTSVWQRNLHYMAACGVGNARAVLLKNPRPIPYDHAAPDFVARRLLLQRYTGLSARQLYQQHLSYLTAMNLKQLALQLQYVDHRLSSVDVGQQQARGAAWPGTVCQLTQNLEIFLAALGSSQQEWDVFAAAHPAGSGPVWEWAQEAAGPEVQRLVGELPCELRQIEADSILKYKSRRPGRTAH